MHAQIGQVGYFLVKESLISWTIYSLATCASDLHNPSDMRIIFSNIDIDFKSRSRMQKIEFAVVQTLVD